MTRNDATWTRRRFLRAAAIGVAGGLAVAVGVEEAVVARALLGRGRPPAFPGAAPTDPRLHFWSRPDLAPHPIAILTPADRVADGYVFLTPGVDGGQADGLMIVDNRGEPVWIHPVSEPTIANLRVQQYRGKPVLTWREGQNVEGHGLGECVVADGAYREIARIRGANGQQCDMHEFLISPEGTALVTAYADVADASTGGRHVLEGIIQEIDIATGKLLFEWHSLGVVAVDESYYKAADASHPFDYFHINSIDVDLDGNLIVSARHTWTVYKLDRSSGAILWRLGGKRSDFTIDPAAAFSWQHDARVHPGGRLSLFDDAYPPTPSRAIVLQLDEVSKTVALVQGYRHPTRISSGTRGNVQLLPNGNAFVGWGGAPFASEFGPAGNLRFDLALWPGDLSYRGFRCVWRGRPSDQPAVAIRRPSSGGTIVYASWNGATDVQTWQILTGDTSTRLQVAASATRRGFETVIALPSVRRFVVARALDGSGTVLGTSALVAVPT